MIKVVAVETSAAQSPDRISPAMSGEKEVATIGSARDALASSGYIFAAAMPNIAEKIPGGIIIRPAAIMPVFAFLGSFAATAACVTAVCGIAFTNMVTNQPTTISRLKPLRPNQGTSLGSEAVSPSTPPTLLSAYMPPKRMPT